jgi:cytoskeletal protein CcmA (bactofilin family)
MQGHAAGIEDKEWTMNNVNSSEEGVHISKGASIDGKITSGGTVRVAGSVKGEVVSKTLIVQEEGVVNGVVSCKNARIAGSVGEELKVEGALFIDGCGAVSGKTNYATLEIVGGGRLNGQVTCVDVKKSSSRSVESNSGDGMAARQNPKTPDIVSDNYANANMKISA